MEQKLPPTQKLILICLSNYADRNGHAFPGQARLAKDSGLKIRAIQINLAKLEENGLLSRERRTREDGSRSSDNYRLNMYTQGAADACRRSTPKAQQKHTQGAADAGGQGAADAGHEPSDSLTVSEPSDNVRARDFDIWYQGYPHKIGKAAAKKAFHSICKKNTVMLQELIDGLARYIKTKPPERSWCNPSTWLNQERWLDEPAIQPLSNPRKTLAERNREDFERQKQEILGKEKTLNLRVVQ
ncbi:MAG: helix-turn-helix domain-containing protein [Chloroflexi bacterium]|nr:helix-turn-helix domain-containing protein [Chloroflexota bacterium]